MLKLLTSKEVSTFNKNNTLIIFFYSHINTIPVYMMSCCLSSGIINQRNREMRKCMPWRAVLFSFKIKIWRQAEKLWKTLIFIFICSWFYIYCNCSHPWPTQSWIGQEQFTALKSKNRNSCELWLWVWKIILFRLHDSLSQWVLLLK